MKVTVVNEFRDRYTDILCTEGMELDITEERYAEIVEAGRYVEPVVEPVVEEPAVEEPVEEKPTKTDKPKK